MLNENEQNELVQQYGELAGMRLIIGFTEVYYTLWLASTFSKVEHVRYLQNLSTDFAVAQQKVAEKIYKRPDLYGNDFDIELDLRGESSWFIRTLAPKRYESNQLSISRFAGKDMRSINPNEQYFSHADKYGVVYKNMSGLLWATYLNEEEKTFKGLRRRVIARECLVTAGILIKIGKEYLTPAQIKNNADKELKASATNGHHFADGFRCELKIKRIGNYGSFDTQYGTNYIFTLIDENGLLFKYVGANRLEIGEDEFISVKATIKHSNYKGVEETKLQRIKINKNEKD